MSVISGSHPKSLRAPMSTSELLYHFGTRDAVVAELMERWYAPLLARVNKVAAEDGLPVGRLRSAILQLIDGVANDVFLGRILMAAADTTSLHATS
ncbi:MAG: hypothetical protein M3O41_07130 [Pseudomonadota bacterium]|nr:hypothetical protein [Pseudomonadota bacterium]